MLKKIFCSLIFFVIGLFFIVAASTVTTLSCNKWGACYRYTMVPFVNYVVGKNTASLENLGNAKYHAECLDYNEMKSNFYLKSDVDRLYRSSKFKKSAKYGLYILKIRSSNVNKFSFGEDFNLNNYVNTYSDNSMCRIDATRLNAMSLKPDFKFTFMKSLADYIYVGIGLIFIILALIILFNKNVKFLSKEDFEKQEIQKSNEEVREAVEEFAKKHEQAIKNFENTVRENTGNINNILQILRSFGIKF